MRDRDSPDPQQANSTFPVDGMQPLWSWEDLRKQNGYITHKDWVDQPKIWQVRLCERKITHPSVSRKTSRHTAQNNKQLEILFHSFACMSDVSQNKIIKMAFEEVEAYQQRSAAGCE